MVAIGNNVDTDADGDIERDVVDSVISVDKEKSRKGG